MFTFTPLLGAQTNSLASQSLLELDGGIKILIGVGWDDCFDVEKLKSLERHVRSISIVLLTHATPAHLAAFAHCCKHFPSFTQIPIYATTPVISLGRTLLQDIYSSTPLVSTVVPENLLRDSSYSYSSSGPETSLKILLQPPTSEEIASYFALIHPLKYSQPHQPLPSPFSPPLNGLTITAYNAGHSLGGTIWHLQHGLESIVYAVDWNQIRENVFSGAAWLDNSGGGGAEVIEQLRKPTALVCSAKGAEKVPMTGGRKKRDDLLLDLIRATVSKGGTVLIPSDSSARILELAFLLEHTWRKISSDGDSSNPLKSAKLYLASRTANATMRYVRSMLEWMDESVAREIDIESVNTSAKQPKRADAKQNFDSAGKTAGPFDFRYIRLLERRKHVEKVSSTRSAKIILASDDSMEWGFSKIVLERIAADPLNLVLLTRGYGFEKQTGELNRGLGETLWVWYNEKRNSIPAESTIDDGKFGQIHPDGKTLEIKMAERKPLEGQELHIYQQHLATRRHLQDPSQSTDGPTLETSADALEDTSSTSSSSSEESDSEKQGKALNASATVAHLTRNKPGLTKEALGINILLRQAGMYDYDVRGKKGREQMFPYITKRRRGDDFGELIRPEDYLRAEERDDTDGQNLRDDRNGKQARLGQKRKWEDLGSQPDTGKQGYNNSNKRRQLSYAAIQVNAINGNRGLNGYALDQDDVLSDGNDSELEEVASGPSKLFFQSKFVQANLGIAYLDFTGLHDQRSLSMLIPLIHPKKLILVGGTASETSYLARELPRKQMAYSIEESERDSNDVFTPINDQTVDASVDTNAWSVKLSEALVRRLHWQKVKGLGIVTLMGHLTSTTIKDRQSPEAVGRKRQKLLKQEADEIKSGERATDTGELAPLLDVIPTNITAATRSVTQPLHVGDLKLADLRKLLQAAGHTAEFRGEGTLLIDGLVAVRKSGTGRVEIEGGGLDLPEPRAQNLEGSFYAVKRKIYDGLAVVAGG